MGGVGGVLVRVALLLLLLLKYYPEEKKMLSVCFYKKEKMFQIYLKGDSKEEPDLKSRCCFTLLELAMTRS